MMAPTLSAHPAQHGNTHASVARCLSSWSAPGSPRLALEEALTVRSSQSMCMSGSSCRTRETLPSRVPQNSTRCGRIWSASWPVMPEACPPPPRHVRPGWLVKHADVGGSGRQGRAGVRARPHLQGAADSGLPDVILHMGQQKHLPMRAQRVACVSGGQAATTLHHTRPHASHQQLRRPCSPRFAPRARARCLPRRRAPPRHLPARWGCSAGAARRGRRW